MSLIRNICGAVISLTTLFSATSAHAFEPSQDDFCFYAPDCSEFQFDIGASYLYWGVYQDQLAYAYQLKESRLGSTRARIKSHKPEWSSGYRVEAAIAHTSSPLDLHFTWTSLNALSRSSTSHDPSGSFAVVPSTFPGLAVDHARSEWKFRLREFAIDLDYTSTYFSCFEFRPYVGVFGLYINQKQDVTNFALADSSPIADVKVTRRNRFGAVGPRVGIAFNWRLFQTLSLISNTNIAVVVGKHKADSSMSTNSNDLAILNSLIGFTNHQYRARPVAGGLLGLEWRNDFCGAYALAISAAYEYQYLWNQFHAISNVLDNKIAADGRWGDLFIQGLTLSAKITF